MCLSNDKRTGKNQRAKGNILFLILLAVVLFAALAYAVTSSMRGGGKDGGEERYSGMASAILQRGALLQATIQRLMLVNDCRETDIDFYSPGNNAASSYQHSPDAPDKCKIFNPAGGGLNYHKIGDLINRADISFGYDSFMSGFDIMTVGTNCTNASCVDLYWLIEISNMPDKVTLCEAYNKVANNSKAVVTIGSGMAGTTFKGVYDYTLQTVGLNNMQTACYLRTDNSRYFIYYVLLAR